MAPDQLFAYLIKLPGGHSRPHLLGKLHVEGLTVGVQETADASQVTGTVVLLNPSYGYLHQLYFQMPAALPDDPSAHAVRLELYAYVPTHNIGLLFQEESGEEKKQTEM